MLLEKHNGIVDKKEIDHSFLEKRIDVNTKDGGEKIKEAKDVYDKIVQYPNYHERLSKLSPDEVRQEFKDNLGKHFDDIPELLQDTLIFLNFPGDNGRSIKTKPDWFDQEKFSKGQAFARDNVMGLLIGQMLGLFCLLSHEDGLRTLSMTKKTHTPFLAYSRYLSTTERVRKWYMEDPWVEGSKVSRDVQAVRRMHSAVRRKLCELGHDKIEEIGRIENPYCPAFSIMRKDFLTSICPDTMENFLYTKIMASPDRPVGLNQVEMSYTLFGFMGMAVLYPKEVGVYAKSDEDLENFCHVWRTYGYLLGIEEDANFCRGSLEDVRRRSREYLEFLVKPSFHNASPQWEHMSRCILVGFGYFLPNISFESAMLRIADLMNIEMPELYASLSYKDWFQYLVGKYFIPWSIKFSIVRYFYNKAINSLLDTAIKANKTKRPDLEEKSRNSMLHVP